MWAKLLAPYQVTNLWSASWQVLTSVILYALFLGGMVYSLTYDYWITLLLAIPTAGFFVRLFIIQHDCGHGAFFPSRAANNTLGFLLGIVTLTPYAYWRKTHAMHHATSGHLDRRGLGDIVTLTVEEYRRLPKHKQLAYRLYRHPCLMFGVGPAFQFLIKHRFPWNFPSRWKREWRSIHLTNLILLAIVTISWMTGGLQPLIMVQLPVILIATSIGGWLFYVQHQFEETYWQHQSHWQFHTAGLQGSSYYDLPKLLRWVTANIGLHHIHHLNSKIPNYNLQQCFDEIPALQHITRVSMWQSLRCPSLKLWDEDQQRLVGFRHLASKF